MLASSSSAICKEIGSDNEVLANKELLDVNKDSYIKDITKDNKLYLEN